MDLGALRIFLAVAHERSFSRAAAKVHRTQPAVSQAVRRLELELGEQLFDRSSKSGTLTEAGKVQQGSLDFGALTFHPAEEGLIEVPVGTDELVLLMPPSHELAKRRQVTLEDIAEEPVVAHNDPSPARERVLRLFEEHHIPLKMV